MVQKKSDPHPRGYVWSSTYRRYIPGPTIWVTVASYKYKAVAEQIVRSWRFIIRRDGKLARDYPVRLRYTDGLYRVQKRNKPYPGIPKGTYPSHLGL